VSTTPSSPGTAVPHAGAPDRRASLRLSATLLLVGLLVFVLVGLLHPDGNANDHPAVFAEYAASATWKLVHLGQFVGMAILLGGLLALSVALDVPAGAARLAARWGAASTVAALALYGVLQGVDGVALKQAVTAWVSAPPDQRAARFASAEAVRWLEWGVRSYQDFALGLALLLLAAAVARAAGIPRPIPALMALSGLAYLVQGWAVGSEGFTRTESIAIVAAFALDLVWMIWLLAVALWPRGPATSSPGLQRAGRAVPAQRAARSEVPEDRT
jgi:hypothetical protein